MASDMAKAALIKYPPKPLTDIEVGYQGCFGNGYGMLNEIGKTITLLNIRYYQIKVINYSSFLNELID